MADKNYSNLFQKYNSVVARNIDLQDQIRTKEEQWKKMEESFHIAEKNARELCEKILATNPEEMSLGKSKPWGSLSFTEIIERTNRAYMRYRQEQQENYRRLLDEQDKRRQKIEELEMKLDRALIGGVVSQEDLEKHVAAEKEQEKIAQIASKSLLDSGTPLTIVKEEDTDFAPDTELDAYDDVAEVNQSVKIMPKSMVYTQNRKNYELKKKRRAEAERSVHYEEIDEASSKVSDTGWKLIEAIGDKGLSVYTEIETYVLQQDPTLAKTAVRQQILMLKNVNIVKNGEKVKNPLKKTFTVYEFTPLGVLVYKNKYGKAPAPSEMGIVIREHGNLEHGYGIKFVADEFRKNKDFVVVSEMNRKKPITLPNSAQYIPDIYIEDKNGLKLYFEYECGNTSQTEFNAKCSKMSSVTSVLNIIGPNKAVTDSLKTQVQKWIANKGENVLKGTTVRIASASAIAAPDAEIIQDQSWQYVFKPGKRTEPYVNY